MVVTFFFFPKNEVALQNSFRSLGRLDWPGIVLSLGTVISLIWALQESGTDYAWNTAPIIAPLVISGSCLITFLVWEVILTKRASKTRMLPVLPARLFTRRVVGLALLYDAPATHSHSLRKQVCLRML